MIQYIQANLDCLVLIFLFVLTNSCMGRKIAKFSYDFFWETFMYENNGEPFEGFFEKLIMYLIWPSFTFNGMKGKPPFISTEEKRYVWKMTVFGIVPKIFLCLVF